MSLGNTGTLMLSYHDKRTMIIFTRKSRHTDTKHYWKLTKHIFRYSHAVDKDAFNGAHTVNEGEHNSMFPD